MIEVGRWPKAVAAGAEGVWVALLPNGPCGSEVVEVDPQTSEVSTRIPIDAWVQDIAAGWGAVWVIGSGCDGGSFLYRIDPGQDEVVATVVIGDYLADVVVDEDTGVWITRDLNSRTGEVLRIDPSNNRLVARIPLDGRLRSIAAGEGAVWVSDTLGNLPLIHIDPASDRVVSTTPGLAGDLVAVGDGVVWAPMWLSALDPSVGTGSDDRSLAVAIDPLTDEVVGEPIDVSTVFRPVAVVDGIVWFLGGPYSPRGICPLDPDTGAIGRCANPGEIADPLPWPVTFDEATSTIWVANQRSTITRIDIG